MIDIDFLTFNDVCHLHDKIIHKYGGIMGIRDKHLLESACQQPQLFLFGEYVHSDIFHMAAAHSFHIIKNHPFVDGNKRTGILTALTFLERNGATVVTDFNSLFNVALDIAQSKLDKEQIAQFYGNSSTI